MNIFKRIWEKVVKAWRDPLKLARDTKAVVRALRLLKAAADSPLASELVRQIPGQVDDSILVALRAALSRLCGIADAWEQFPYIMDKEDPKRNAILHKAGSMAITQLHGVPECQADHMVQLEYMHQKFNR